MEVLETSLAPTTKPEVVLVHPHLTHHRNGNSIFNNQSYHGFTRKVSFDPMTPIDSMVPFIGWTFMIYVSLYLYYPAAAWFGRENDKRIREMFAFYQSLFTMTWAVFLIFIIFPTEIYIRDDIPQSVLSGEGFWGSGTMIYCTKLTFRTMHGLVCMSLNHC